MGILDDAIREHLELKRSHGAADEDIRRQEAEVFGPARAEAAPAEPAPAPADEEHTQLLTPESEPDVDELQPAPEDPYVVHPGEELVPDPDVPSPAPEEHDAAPPEEHLSPAAEAGAGMLEPHRVDPGPPGVTHDPHFREEEEHPALVDHDDIGGEEHAPEPVFGHEAEAPATEEEPSGEEVEDPLEDTPEFLQDAPEHDRLWFEQKPPRDFDFGE